MPGRRVEELREQSLCLRPLPSVLPASPKPSCLSIVCVPLLQRNPCLGRELPLALWCPRLPVGFPPCRCPVSSRRAVNLWLSPSCGGEPCGAAESAGRAVSSRLLWGCSRLASHAAPLTCMVRSHLPVDVSPTPRPATCARGFPIACAAVGRARGALPGPYLCPPRTRAEAGALQRGHPLLRAELGEHHSRAAQVPVPCPLPCWGPQGPRESTQAAWVAADFVPACVCALGEELPSQIGLRGSTPGSSPGSRGRAPSSRHRAGLCPAVPGGEQPEGLGPAL